MHSGKQTRVLCKKQPNLLPVPQNATLVACYSRSEEDSVTKTLSSNWCSLKPLPLLCFTKLGLSFGERNQAEVMPPWLAFIKCYSLRNTAPIQRWTVEWPYFCLPSHAVGLLRVSETSKQQARTQSGCIWVQILPSPFNVILNSLGSLFPFSLFGVQSQVSHTLTRQAANHWATPLLWPVCKAETNLF